MNVFSTRPSNAKSEVSGPLTDDYAHNRGVAEIKPEEGFEPSTYSLRRNRSAS